VRHGHLVVWPQVEACVAEIMAGQTGPLLSQLDHLEASLDEASFVKRAARSPGKRHHG
jgi:hypothetical protein